DRLQTLALDVSDSGQVQTAVRQLTDRLGRIDILVNNAGTNLKERRMRELTPEGWDPLIRTNLDGAFYCTRAALPQMPQRCVGRLRNLRTLDGKGTAPRGGAAYAASKSGIAAMGIGRAAEEKDTGLRDSTISPGEVDTPILGGPPQPITEEPRRRILQPEDVA